MQLNQETLTLLAQIPLAGIVVVVVSLFLWFLRDWAKAEREARSQENSATRDFMSVQNELFLQSVKEIREQNNAALQRLIDEIKTNTLKLADLHSVVVTHDAKSELRDRSAKT